MGICASIHCRSGYLYGQVCRVIRHDRELLLLFVSPGVYIQLFGYDTI